MVAGESSAATITSHASVEAARSYNPDAGFGINSNLCGQINSVDHLLPIVNIPVALTVPILFDVGNRCDRAAQRARPRCLQADVGRPWSDRVLPTRQVAGPNGPADVLAPERYMLLPRCNHTVVRGLNQTVLCEGRCPRSDCRTATGLWSIYRRGVDEREQLVSQLWQLRQ